MKSYIAANIPGIVVLDIVPPSPHLPVCCLAFENKFVDARAERLKIAVWVP